MLLANYQYHLALKIRLTCHDLSVWSTLLPIQHTKSIVLLQKPFVVMIHNDRSSDWAFHVWLLFPYLHSSLQTLMFEPLTPFPPSFDPKKGPTISRTPCSLNVNSSTEEVRGNQNALLELLELLIRAMNDAQRRFVRTVLAICLS